MLFTSLEIGVKVVLDPSMHPSFGFHVPTGVLGLITGGGTAQAVAQK